MQTLTLTPQTQTSWNLMHTHTVSHKDEEVFQVICKTQGDPLIDCVIMIGLKIQKKEKRQTHSAGHEWQGQAEGEV